MGGHYRDVLGARGSHAAAEAEGASAPLHPPRTMVAAAHSGARLLLLVLRVGFLVSAAGPAADEVTSLWDGGEDEGEGEGESGHRLDRLDRFPANGSV